MKNRHTLLTFSITALALSAVLFQPWKKPDAAIQPPPDPVVADAEDLQVPYVPHRKALDDKTRGEELETLIEHIEILHKELDPPGKGDWLSHYKEKGQTFRQYLDCNPVRPDEVRRYLYIQPIGEFTKTQRKIIKLAARFMSLYFNLQVKVAKDMPLSEIPDHARRIHKTWKDKQLYAPYILDYVLFPRLQDDAAAYIAFTASDLYPHESWNFVYGLASLEKRVGVWSIYRNGNPDKDEESFRLCLLRTLKLATHETGHMFSMKHCIAFNCNMCGCNNREESDRNPLWLCPQCVAKVCFATRTNPLDRYELLAKFCCENDLVREARFYNRSREKIKDGAEESEEGEKGARKGKNEGTRSQ